MLNKRQLAIWSGVSVAISASVVRAALRWAALSDLRWSWWLPSFELLRVVDDVAWSALSFALIALGYGIKQNSHSIVAVTSMSTVVATYLFTLQVLSQRPADFVDPRILFTMVDALVPLYVAGFALLAHAWIALRSRG